MKILMWNVSTSSFLVVHGIFRQLIKMYPLRKSAQRYREEQCRRQRRAHQFADTSLKTCTICLDNVTCRGILSVCDHWFCFDCIHEWSKVLCCFVNTFPANMYLFKVNNRNTRERCEICSNLTINTSELCHWRCHWRCSGVFIVNFEDISHLF